MCIKVKQEPEEFKELPKEQCIWCQVETDMWSEEFNRPICAVCAQIHSPWQIKDAPYNY